MSSSPATSTAAAAAAVAAATAATLHVYVRTAYLSIPGGDAGELVAEACALGQAHPPGYPLFTLLYHWAVQALDTGDASVAWRANVVSAALAALATGFLALATFGAVRLAGLRGDVFAALASASSALAFAFSPLVWQYSTGAEVFALNNLLVGVLLWLTVAYGNARSPGRRDAIVALGALWCGLALCNQHTVVLFEVPLIGAILAHEHLAGRVTGARLVFWGALFLVGLAPYAYLPIAQTVNRQQGSWGDTTSIWGFIHHLRRGDYGTFRLYSRNGPGEVFTRERVAMYFWDALTRQGLYVVPVVAVLGMWKGLITAPQVPPTADVSTRKKRPKKQAHGQQAADARLARAAQEATKRGGRTIRALVAAFWFYTFVFHFLSNMPLNEALLFGVQARFWMQPNMLLFLFGGVGLCELKGRVDEAMAPGSAFRRASAALVHASLVLLVAGQYAKNLQVSDQSENAILESYARALTAPLPDKALLIVGYDQQWTALRYLQQCTGFRENLTIVNGPMMSYSWLEAYHDVYHHDPHKCLRFPGPKWVSAPKRPDNPGFTSLELFDRNMEGCRGGIFYTGKLMFANDTTWKTKYRVESVGLVHQVVRQTKATDEARFQDWLRKAVPAWELVDHTLQGQTPSLSKYSQETWEWTVHRDMYDHIMDDGAAILDHAVAKTDVGLMSLAALFLQRGYLADRTEMKWGSMKNLGLAYVRMLQSGVAEFPSDHPLLGAARMAKIRHALFGEQDWRSVAAVLGMRYWGEFLEMPGATSDPAYNTIKDVLASMQKAK